MNNLLSNAILHPHIYKYMTNDNDNDYGNG